MLGCLAPALAAEASGRSETGLVVECALSWCDLPTSALVLLVAAETACALKCFGACVVCDVCMAVRDCVVVLVCIVRLGDVGASDVGAFDCAVAVVGLGFYG